LGNGDEREFSHEVSLPDSYFDTLDVEEFEDRLLGVSEVELEGGKLSDLYFNAPDVVEFDNRLEEVGEVELASDRLSDLYFEDAGGVDLFELNMPDHSSSAKMTQSINVYVPVNLINGLAVNLHR
jgi:hypothetical protein